METQSIPFADNACEADELDTSHEHLYRRVATRVLPLLFVCYFVSYLDRVNIGFAKLQMLSDLGFSDAVYAAGASAFFWGYVAFEVPSNVLLHKFGARLWIARIMVSWGLLSMSLAFTAQIAAATHLSQGHVFYFLRVMLGVAEAGFFPGVVLYVSYWFPAERQSRVMAVFLSAISVSLVVGGPLSGAVMEHAGGLLQLKGWQSLILAEGMPAVMLGIFVAIWLDNNVDDARWLSADEKAILKANLDSTAVHQTGHLGAALRDRRVWTLAGIMFTFSVAIYGLSFWLPTIINNAGVENKFQIGVLSAIPWAVATVVMVLNAFHSHKHDERRWHAAIPALVAGVTLAGSAVTAHHFVASFLLMVVSAAGIMALIPIFFTFPASILTGHAKPAGIAFITSIGSIAGMFGAFINSVAKDLTGDINNGTYVLGLSIALAGMLVLSLPKNVFCHKGT